MLAPVDTRQKKLDGVWTGLVENKELICEWLLLEFQPILSRYSGMKYPFAHGVGKYLLHSLIGLSLVNEINLAEQAIGRFVCSGHIRVPCDGRLLLGAGTMNRSLVYVLLVFIAFSGCGKSTPGTLVESGYDEQEMKAAIARARGEVDSFISELAKPTGTDHAVKSPIEDGGKIEHFWLTDVTFQNGEFKGTINNDPGIVGNVKFGQSWTIKKSDISDWMFMRDGKMYGNYTMRPLLKAMPEEEAAQFRSIFATP